MTNDEDPPNGFDPLKDGILFNAMACWAMPPIFAHRPARQAERPATQDWRDEQLARAAYLVIVGIERAVRAVASFVSRVGRYAARQVSPRDASAQPRASRPRL
jgi:hypothetical protein